MSQKEQNQDPKKHDAYDLRAVFEEIELDLIRNLRRNLKWHEKEEEEEGFRWEMWQKAKLRNIAKYRKKNREIVGERSKEIEEIINKTLQESFDTAESMMQKLFRKVKSFFTRRGMQYPKDISNRGLEKRALPEESFFDVNGKKIDALQKTAKPLTEPEKQPEVPPQPVGAYVPEGKEKELTGKDNGQKLDDLKQQVSRDMKEAEGAIWRRMDDIYRQTIYKTEMFMAAGAKSLDQAIDMATKEFLDGGIDCIEYKNGRRVNIASYAEMALRTASQRATFLAEGKKRDEWGIHTVFVSAHANTCLKCEPWQGKVLVDDVFSSGTATEAAALGVPLLSTAMKAGLLHPNCRHTLATYFPGITILPKVPNKDKALKTYEAEQKQRVLERKIRKWKRIAEGSLDERIVSYANDKLTVYRKELQEHLKEHPELRRDYTRENTRGLTEQLKGNVSEARADKMFYVVPPVKGDAIKAHSLYKNLNKSEIGRRVLEYIEQKQVDIEITYSDEVGEGLRGRTFGNHIEIFARNTLTIKETAKALIHETTHMMYDIGEDQWSEVVCMLKELEHEKGMLTVEDKRTTIKVVKRLYPELPWRKR